jgi:methylamine dehydrogenase heavy chain
MSLWRLLRRCQESTPILFDTENYLSTGGLMLRIRRCALIIAANFGLVACTTLPESQVTNSSASSEAQNATIQGPAITGAEKTDSSDQNLPAYDPSLPPLPIEPLGQIATLPETYPETWVLVNELSFFSMYGGKVIIMDAAETKPERRIKGTMDKFLMGNFTQSPTRGEYYVLETFHERGSRGKRTDVLAFYDKSTLTLEDEIVWPKPGRLQALPERYAMSVSGDEKFLYAANMNPATSTTVIDLDTRKITAQIQTPGCVLSYPIGKRSVASICSNGALLTSVIDDTGQLVKQSMSEPFFDPMQTPVFEHPVYFDGQLLFPSFTGLIHSFDITGEIARYSGHWDLVSEQDKAEDWRPSGLVLNDVDDQGHLYTIFHPNGHEGSQTHGGPQVWVFDLKTRSRIRIIEVPNWAISVSVTRGKDPLLIVSSGNLELDVFDANTGEFIQTLADFGNVTPLSVEKTY